ncbi:cytochrome b-c1 complex subunit 7-like [Tubulanus polymorphus]|uniref:cytochrome b-c1 complex subunit 7-like n=1 Tax=Tubulanus polymorphus TaxID=672921 RepID=UPI003DA39112
MAAVRKVIQKAAKPKWLIPLCRWAYNKSYFRELGLRKDDILHETPEVKEAIRRLPSELYDARMFRISRALYLSSNKTVLPKEEWTVYDEDERYLEPYLNEVFSERDEKWMWNKQ